MLSKKIYNFFYNIYKDNKFLPKTEFILMAEKSSEIGLNVLAEELMTINNPPRLKIRRYFKMKLPILGLRETVDFPDSNYIYMLMGEVYLKFKHKGIQTIETKIASLESLTIWEHWDNFFVNILKLKIDYEQRVLLSNNKTGINLLISDKIEKILKSANDDQVKCLRNILGQIDIILNLRKDNFIVRHFENRVLPFYQYLTQHSLTDLRYFLKEEKFKMRYLSISKVISVYAQRNNEEFQKFENSSNVIIAESKKIKFEKFKFLVKKGDIDEAFEYIVQNNLIQVKIIIF